MTQANNCSYCRHKFCHKFRYRNWQSIAERLYEASVKRMSPMLSLAFIFDGREFVIEMNEDKVTECAGDLSIPLVEPMTREVFRNRSGGVMDYRWPSQDKNCDMKVRTLELLQKVSVADAKLDMHIQVQDFLGSGETHVCGVTTIVAGNHTRIHLSEAWTHAL